MMLTQRDLYIKMPNNSQRYGWLQAQYEACRLNRMELIELEVRNMEFEERQKQQQKNEREREDDGDNPDWTGTGWFSRQTNPLAPLGDATKQMMERAERIIRGAGGASGAGGISAPAPFKAHPRFRAVPLR